ncbi:MULTISPECIES: sigma-70 family RNA polymerase sigma factor [unclassified Streptomyces]|uniref:sigma-70 family RNA polymerase sigma factor n=1 Tax=unclassified Streptomyces TaxID=2593676 RepID=UPI00226F9BD8|nr:MULTISPECIES: sigma-70 family RNA polymerase sigma factor [unclassified Streptomyces]MCY0923579.1 sigma-70 family RNA polymerase sigma factor [Streptomyces sp. H27-G5]MCY0962028.1 sigma-70 family RNA polymerase sigma factor [Streptomyces sp. H27-H5]
MDQEQLDAALDAALSQLKELTDPLERAKTAHSLTGWVQDYGNELQVVRNEAMNAALRTGNLNSTQLATELGISKARVSQLAKGSPPERLFLGSGTVIVALAEKLEAGKEHAAQGPVIATPDFQTYSKLNELAQEVGLACTMEPIPVGGNVRLNRNNLVVICGPRLSPLLEQILEGDPHLRFAKDAEGWYLTDRTSGKTYRSPSDSGENSDVAYFGRLPRPDGQGTFLYVAGIHAIGSGGVIHWLTKELANVHSELRAKRFSTLISSRFDPKTGEILESERITPFYRPEGA